MIRFRRYRVFVVGALALLLLLFRVAQNSQWELEAGSAALYNRYSHAGTRDSKPTYETPAQPAPPPGREPVRKQLEQRPVVNNSPPADKEIDKKLHALKPDPSLPERIPDANHAAGLDSTIAAPAVVPKPIVDPALNDQRPVVAAPATSSSTAPSTSATRIHWKKMPEHYPIPASEVIPLPTGRPKLIPTVQHKFGNESPTGKVKREARLAQVKKEMKRAWSSYRQFAWGHDEVAPIELVPRDPFCGWAATLVDALDTLWIMDMKEEFNEAYAYLEKIDFTTLDRSDIPVFETIIRYLGGLLAAYDVSGGKEGKHPRLLEKAEELATVLMSVFDTPNRMPILYYQWKPKDASQPMRANTQVSVAELGSMSMEFTRLAQLTGNDRYYDAIARITNAFDDWQKRGTSLDGIFPQQVDASGCNRTIIPRPKEEVAYARKLADEVDESGSVVGPLDKKVDLPTKKTAISEEETSSGSGKVSRRGVAAANSGSTTPSEDATTNDSEVPGVPKARANPHPDRDVWTSGNPVWASSNSINADQDCRPQGLTETYAGTGSYSMGGSQDSAYEYFPKQYILLGGLVDQYRRLHENTVAAVKKYLLYRPMIKEEDRRLLFSANVMTRGSGKDLRLSYTYEVTHLTCFLGGMFALGGRIFESKEDLTIAAQLADGCVWAYESMASGIMPENSNVVPCESVESCPWNETLWHEHLDPNAVWRDNQVADYKVRKKEWDELYNQATLKAKADADADWEAKKLRALGGSSASSSSKKANAPSPDMVSVLDGAFPKDDVPRSDEHPTSSNKNKRSVVDNSWSAGRASGGAGRAPAANPAMVGAEDAIGGVRSSISFEEANAQQAVIKDPFWDLPPEPKKPQSHKEYVKDRIEMEKIPPGFTTLLDRRYILRPEAIESVWYMYRVTGDTIWQEKGWKMFESVIRATTTQYGHSAIEDVSISASAWSNNMESFWLAETLKYFYLLYTTPDVISLDEWVLNTEAHPFKRQT